MVVKDDSLNSGNQTSNTSSGGAMASTASFRATASLMSTTQEYGISTGQSMSATLCSSEQESSTSTNIMQQATRTATETVGRGTPTSLVKVASNDGSGVSSLGSEPPMKTSLSESQISDSTPDLIAGNLNPKKEDGEKQPTLNRPFAPATPTAVSPSKAKGDPTSVAGAKPLGASSPSSNPAISMPPPPQTTGPPSPPPPLKAITMSHLRKKYTAELQYMLREFRKLERQLLGAKGIEESAGSRERREKLHSFILHLEDTIRQIDLGCRLEAEGKSTAMVGVSSASVGAIAPGNMGEVASTSGESFQKKLENSALTNLTKEKEEEENVQKLEEHILANLLPVKVRLTRQLAAQQGASRNPAGMPAARRGMLQPAVEKGKGTFAAAAEQRRKQAEAVRAASQEQLDTDIDSSQFGKPLKGGGSSLTQKLHGATLGSNNRDQSAADEGSAVESAEEVRERTVQYAGMAPGSEQVRSSVSAAIGAHGMVVEDPALISTLRREKEQAAVDKAQHSDVSSSSPRAAAQHVALASDSSLPSTKEMMRHAAKMNAAIMAGSPSNKRRCDDFILTDEERKKLRKKRKRKHKRREARRLEIERQRHMLLQQQAVQASQLPNKGAISSAGGKKVTKGSGTNKTTGKKKGPRTVEYICALCSEAYSSTCDANPWWALTSHECPKCRKTQIPRVDITSAANAIEYHPALLAHAEDTSNSGGNGSGVSGAGTGVGVMHLNPTHMSSSLAVSVPLAGNKMGSDSDSGSDFSDDSDAGHLSDDSMDTDDSGLMSMSPGEEAEKERFGREYTGPTLSASESSRLLTLFSHASTCPGRHKSAKHRDVCHSTKFLMLHVRDCPGTTSSFDVCPFPWCRKVKHLLYHLVACPRPRQCGICTPSDLSPNLKALVGLNDFRRKKQRARMAAAMKAAAAAKARAAAAASKPSTARASTHHKKSTGPASKSTLHKGWGAPANASTPSGKARTQSAINAARKPAFTGASRPLPAVKQPVPTPMSRPGPAASTKLPGSTAKAPSVSPIRTPARASVGASPTIPPAAAMTSKLPVMQPPATTATASSSKQTATQSPATIQATSKPQATPPLPSMALGKRPLTGFSAPSTPGNTLPTGVKTVQQSAIYAEVGCPKPAQASGGECSASVEETADNLAMKKIGREEAPPLSIGTSAVPPPEAPQESINTTLDAPGASTITSDAKQSDRVAAAVASAEATPLSPAVADLGEATLSPTILGSSCNDEKSPDASIREIHKDLPPRLKFPKLETDENNAAALIEDHASSGQSESETGSDLVCTRRKETWVTMKESATDPVVLKKPTADFEEQHDVPLPSNSSTPSPSSENLAEKKTEPVRIGC